MTARRAHIDRLFFWSVISLAVAGYLIFLSASLGLLAQNGASFGTVALKQTVSLLIGFAVFYAFSRMPYQWLRKYSLFILIGAVFLNLLLFVPHLSLYHGGAARWINIGPLSFQPSEFLKVAFIVYLAAWVRYAKDRIKDMRFGLLPYAAIMAVLGGLLLAQSDTDTLVIIGGTGAVMMLIAGMPIKHVALAGLLMVAVVAGVIALRPYALERVKTFLSPSANSQGSGYQINQSLIAIGSGGIVGRGFGQSIQKFGYLPQPTDDSIFAVASEEFGFLGASTLIALYVLFAAAAFRVGARSADQFGGMLASGIGILVVTESFMNMAAMMGLLPLSGVPLLFVSHGGTALIITLMAAGIVANISKRREVL
ncbi:MAG: cell division protein FtsW [Patescibacteria group bacterium]|nr:cell division protein FtsW [Patescibacteria group bacterium]